MRAYEKRKISLSDRLQSVGQCFIENGFDFESPFLNLGSVDEFKFAPRLRRDPTIRLQQEMSGAQCLKAAAEIGQTLARQAIWQDDRCNWIGAEFVRDDQKSNSYFNTVFKSLGPNVYDGTSGIAMFLARLAVLTGDPQVRRTALGAIRHALGRFGGARAVNRIGFYSGLIGIACAAADVGRILGEKVCTRAPLSC